MKKILLISCILVWGCASVPIDVPITATAKDNTFQAMADLKSDIQAQFKAQAEVNTKLVAGIDNSSSSKTEQSAGRDFQQINDSEMIKDLFARYTGMVEKLIASNNRTIYILIIQLCALLTLFIKKDWDMSKRLMEKDERINNMLMKFITDDEEREDARALLNGHKKDIG